MSSRQAIGIDVGGTNLRVARVSSAGEILASASERVSRDPALALEHILALTLDLDDPAVTSIGVGIPGRVNAATRQVLSGGFLDLAGVSLIERLEAVTGKPACLDTDCNMALVAEMQAGAARGRRHVAMFTIGTGIGGAIALDGEILRGRSSAGQLGHLTVDVAGLPCACGRFGCVETMSSGTALGRLIAEAGLPTGTRIEALLAAVDVDPVARAVVTAWAGPLRAAIDSVAAAMDPELVLLGGGLGHAACEALRLAPAQSSWYQVDVMPAVLGDDAGVVGGALSALAKDAAS